MLREMGVPLPWTSLTEPLGHTSDSIALTVSSQLEASPAGLDGRPQQVNSINEGVAGSGDQRFRPAPEAVTAWQQISALGPTEDLPIGMPAAFYFNLHSHMQSGDYATALEPYLKHFPRSK